MLNSCRRGPASISRVFRAASSTIRIPSTRPSTLSISLQSTTKPALEARWVHMSSKLRNQYAAARSHERYDDVQDSQPDTSADFAEVTKFHQLIENNLAHPNVVEQITKVMGHDTMTEVQTLTINQALQGTDIIAQARTGTGKTIGFLLPTIQNILKKNPELAQRKRYSRARPSDIRAIIISPTRELAEQIAVEAEKLCDNTDLRVQVAVGGNSKRAMLQKMQREGCHLLVATPGRLNDLLTDEYSRVSAPELTTLVLDEADRLLDDGFSKDIEDIIHLLPNRNAVDRQTLLFSATVPREVMHLVRRTLKPDFHFVQTVQEGDVATHEKVPQMLVAVPGLENFMPTLLELSKREVERAAVAYSAGTDAKPFKAIVYFSSTANVELGARIFENLKSEGGGLFGKHPLWPAEVSEMHGQLTQQQRTRVSERFRRAKSAIMFSTDVTARGMDFPNVSHVIQIGLPPNREQYIHRIGRTGRGSASGEGWILISENDLPEARRRLRGLPISADKTLEAAKVDMTRDAQLPASLAATLSQIGDATKMVDRQTKTAAYMAALGQAGGNGKENVMTLNQWTRYGWGWDMPPAVNARLAQKLGISRVPGINIQSRDRPHDEDHDDALNGLSNGGFGGSRGGSDRYGGDRGGFGNRGSSGGGFGDRGGDRGERAGRSSSYKDNRAGGGRSFGRRDYGGRKSLNDRYSGDRRGFAPRETASF